MASRHYDISPYSYCAGNPIRFVDPEGKYWVNAEDKKLITRELYNDINSNNAYIKRLKKRQEGLSNTRKIMQLEKRITDYQKRNVFLNIALEDVQRISDSPIGFRLSVPDNNSGYHRVVMNQDGIISIQGSDMGLYIHEMRHVGQAINANRLRFNHQGFLINPGTTRKDRINFELDAYKTQLSTGGGVINSPSFLSDIDEKWLSQIIDENGKMVYETLFR